MIFLLSKQQTRFKDLFFNHVPLVVFSLRTHGNILSPSQMKFWMELYAYNIFVFNLIIFTWIFYSWLSQIWSQSCWDIDYRFNKSVPTYVRFCFGNFTLSYKQKLLVCNTLLFEMPPLQCPYERFPLLFQNVVLFNQLDHHINIDRYLSREPMHSVTKGNISLFDSILMYF